MKHPPPTLLIGHGFEANYLLGFARGLHAQGVDLLVTADDTSAPLLAVMGLAGSADRADLLARVLHPSPRVRLAAVVALRRRTVVPFSTVRTSGVDVIATP